MKAILIYSGGLDSTTLLYEYKDSIALAVTFDYGSKHNAREIACAVENCRRLGIPHQVIPLEFIGKYFRSDLLLSGGDIPEGSYADDNMKSTVVPFRNGIMLSIAAGIAENNKLQYVMLANHAGDHTIYPDCRPEFVEAMNNAIHFGTWNGVQLLTPYTRLTKAEIASKGKELNLDYSETWSCYKGGEHHCGVCGTCRERKEALAQAGIEDKTIYDC